MLNLVNTEVQGSTFHCDLEEKHLPVQFSRFLKTKGSLWRLFCTSPLVPACPLRGGHASPLGFIPARTFVTFCLTTVLH